MQPTVDGASPGSASDAAGITALGIASVLLRWRRVIIALGIGAGLWGLIQGLTSERVYKASATFVPQSSEAGPSGFAAAASQLGIRVPAGGGGWGPAQYISLLKSRALLEPIALDTVTVVEEGRRRASVMDIFGIQAPTPQRRLVRAVQTLGSIIVAEENKTLGAVTVSVTTSWPSVSLALVERVVARVSQFNRETRRSQAQAERRFVETQAAEAEVALRLAEDRLQSFLLRNRAVASPQLSFEHDRLKRDVELRQELYTAWMKSREDARIREVRDTPVITLLEEPRLPAVGESRRSVQRAISRGILGGLVGIMLAFLFEGLAKARRRPGPETQEFFRLLDEAVPGFLRRRR